MVVLRPSHLSTLSSMVETSRGVHDLHRNGLPRPCVGVRKKKKKNRQMKNEQQWKMKR